jgi:hypothetical protein
VGGAAFLIMVFFLATDFLTDVNIINMSGDIKSIEEINSYSLSDLRKLKKNDYFLDYVTGDLLSYNNVNSSWIPKMNIGIHNSQTAQKYSNV